MKVFAFFLIMASGYLISDHCPAQIITQKYYDRYAYDKLIDSLRLLNNHLVVPELDELELATQIALLHYPELQGNRVRIKYKKNVRYPITASWALGNIFKSRKNHTYILLVHPDSFVTKRDLNTQIGIVGHEMAHFVYYRERPGIHMLWWGIRYISSRRFRMGFERSADFSTVDHNLGWQTLEVSFYTTRKELEEYKLFLNRSSRL